MKQITLRKNVWNTDEEYTLEFPETWEIKVYRDQEIPKLTESEIDLKLDTPISCETLSSLASDKHTAIILIDDISRPTPTSLLLPKIISRLTASGIQREKITILIATGTHKQSTQENLLHKIELDHLDGIRVLIHDAHKDCVLLGETKSGTPIFINREVMEKDIKICLSSIYPHPVAGYSGGSKLAVVGAGGYQTIRTLHDLHAGTSERTGKIDHPFRWEINEIAKRIGIDFCINLVLNQNREVCNLFCGDAEQAFINAVEFVKPVFSAPIDQEADIVISDLYPFDREFQFGFDRSLWPFESAKAGSKKIFLASCLSGIGSHELFPVKDPILSRLLRRVINFNFKELTYLGDRLKSVKKILWRRSLNVLVVSPNIDENDLKMVLPHARVVSEWEAALSQLQAAYPNKPVIKVAIYKTAPLMLPLIKEK